jgi:hypothetical protein
MKMKKALLLIMVIMSIFAAGSVFADSDYSKVKATLLNQDPDPAQPGDYLELRWKVEKLGNEAVDDVRYKLEVEYPFSFDNSDKSEKLIGSWKGYSEEDEFYTLYYKLRVDDDALEDTYTLKLKNTHADTELWYTEEYDVRVGEKQETKFVLGNIVTSPIKLTADLKEAEIHVDLENIGDADAEAVSVELDMPEGFTASYSGSDRESLGTIEAGQSKTGIFYIDTDENLVGGDYTFKTIINYKEEGDEDNEYKSVLKTFDIHVNDLPKFELVSFETMPEIVYPGSVVSVKLVVKNVGGEEGESVSLRAFKESSQPFEFEEKSDFIGKLAPGEEGEVILKLDVDKDANPKKYNLDVEIRSIDGNTVLIDEDQFSFEVVHGSEEKDYSSLITIAIVALIAGLIGFFIGMKYSKKNSGRKK